MVIDLPKSGEVAKAWWPQKQKKLMKGLESECFAGWSKDAGKVTFQNLGTVGIGAGVVGGLQLAILITEPGTELMIQIRHDKNPQGPIHLYVRQRTLVRIQRTDSRRMLHLVTEPPWREGEFVGCRRLQLPDDTISSPLRTLGTNS